MKRFAIAALSALTLATTMGATAAYADAPRYDRHDDRNRYDNDRRDNRWDNNRHDNRYDNNRYDNRWNDNDRGWRRGGRLTQHYREWDWRRAHYRAPPRGYHYVRTDRGEILLVGLATGLILGAIANGN